LDSGLIGTKSGQAQMMLNMIQAGFFKDGDVSPTIRQEILQRMGMSTFTDEVNNDVERAESENVSVASGELKVMLAEPDPETGEDVVVNLDPFFKYDNHGIHYDTHRKYIISPEFAELPEQYQTVMIHHADLHQKMINDQPPDIRDYIQIDKLLLPGVLKESERAQVLDKYLGIQAGDESFTGLPDAETIAKLNQKTSDTDKKTAVKQQEIKADFAKHTMSEGVKLNALRNQESKGRGESGKSQPRV
jgi:hypothetical protein